jgi:RNA polymerase sigma-70 factor (ECF subfamily)
VNAAHDVRAKRREQPAEEPPDPLDPRDRFAEQELSSELQRALDALDETYRVAVVLYDVLGCSYAEIAELTDVPEGTVKSRIFRGRSELAERLGTEGERAESND